MCGLIAAFETAQNKKKAGIVNEFIVNQFEDQSTRGTRGFGIIRIDNKRKIEIDRACETTKFLVDLYLKPSSMIIAHHRTPTSTDNMMDQTHPMFISNDLLDYDYLIVHNGMVTNDKELRLKHLELGFKYKTEYTEVAYTKEEQVWNDSESIAIELALFIEKRTSAIGLDNYAALIALQIDKKTQKAKEVFFGRNGLASALNMLKTENSLKLSSVGPGEEIKVNTLFSFDIKDPTMTLKEIPLPFIKKEIPKIEAPKVTTNQTMNLPVKKEDIDKASERSWKDTYISYNRDANYLPPYAGKDYIEEAKKKFLEAIITEDSSGIETQTEASLDEEVEKIGELMADFKETLMLEKLPKSDIMFYTGQIYRVTKAMEEIANLGEDAHKVALEKEAAEKEIEEYNESFGIPSRKAHISERDREMAIEASLANRMDDYGYNIE